VKARAVGWNKKYSFAAAAVFPCRIFRKSYATNASDQYCTFKSDSEKKVSGMLRAMALRLGKMLFAIFLGNLVYFLWMPYLPLALRHTAHRFDPGLVFDFILCVAMYQPIRRI
jgi:hypothetical protein